jgi:integrase
VTERRSDILEGIWNIPTEPGEKANAEILQFPNVALDIIDAQPINCRQLIRVRGHNRTLLIFPTQEELDEKLRKHLPDMPQWQLHDLRRTAKTLADQAGVRPDISERVLGHAIPGVERVYDQYAYSKEDRCLGEAGGPIREITK